MISARPAIQQFLSWLEQFGETSQDQYDFWAMPLGRFAKALYYRNKRIALPLVTPFVFLDTFIPSCRFLVRGRQRFPIADAHYALGFFALAMAEQTAKWIERGEEFLRNLLAERCKGFTNCCWGYPFDWVTCVGTFRADTPLITSTPYGYEAFEAGYEATGNPEYLKLMRSVAAFAFEDLQETEIASGIYACSYTPYDRRAVVNANAYRSYLLITAGHRFQNPGWIEAATRSLRFVLHSQNRDGSWLYALDGKDLFVDNFHTCFVLKNLVKIWRIIQSDEVLDAVRRGYNYYKIRLLDQDGLPIPFAKRSHASFARRELYDYAEGINLAMLLRGLDPESPAILRCMLESLLRNWRLPDGHFMTRETMCGRNTVPYHRWAQAQTFRVLALYCADEVA